MSGSIYYRKDRRRWIVSWVWEGKEYKISRYQGDLMHGNGVRNKKKDSGFRSAEKLLAQMQGDVERKIFRIEKYTVAGWCDVIEFYYQWIKDEIKDCRKPATIKNYVSYGKNWIKPFFTENPMMLHEIKADTLQRMLKYILKGLKDKKSEGSPITDLILNYFKKAPDISGAEIHKRLKKDHGIKVSASWVRRTIAKAKAPVKQTENKEKNIGKTALNIMSAFHSMMDYAFRSERIFIMPPFPKKESYQLKPKNIDYLSPIEFNKVASNIPSEHYPIFQFLKLHYRRPGEACALHKSDYDQVNGVFKIHRAISARQLVDSVKTNWKNQKSHMILCDDDFMPTANRLMSENLDSPFLFVNPRARKKGKRYTLESLRNIWYAACDAANLRRIWPYKGTKHTACMEFLENGGTGDELMIETDHANRKSVDAYIEITMKRKKMARAAAKKRARKKEEMNGQGSLPDNVISFNRR